LGGAIYIGLMELPEGAISRNPYLSRVKFPVLGGAIAPVALPLDPPLIQGKSDTWETRYLSSALSLVDINLRRVPHQMIDDLENLTDVFVPHYTQSSKYRVFCTPIMWIASIKPHLLT